MSLDFTISCNVLGKMLLHSGKYPHLAVSGILLASSRKNENSSEILLTDAVPLFHGQLSLTPMLEIALTKIEKIYKDEGKYIAGYYQANENIKDCIPDFVAMKIAEKIAENNNDACIIMIDNRKILMQLESVPIILSQLTSDGKWKTKEKTGVHIETDSLSIVSQLLQMKAQQNIVDFDNHLDNISCDITNGEITNLIENIKGGGNSFYYTNKTSVLQEARVFNENPVNMKQSRHVLAKILYLINQGEILVAKDATDVFFAMTKLFQSDDLAFKHLVQLGIKEFFNIAEDTIIVTSSLTKDMTRREDQYRASAIRALCRITEATKMQPIERYMKQAIVDRAPRVSSAALVSCRHIMTNSPDVVKRCVSEVQEAVSSDNEMVQFHALGVLHQIRKSDKLAVTKMILKFIGSGLKFPNAICLLIRIVAQLIGEDELGADSHLFDFLKSMLHHKAEMVICEAANAIVSLKKSTIKELHPTIAVLQVLRFSPKSSVCLQRVVRRTLMKVLYNHPSAIATYDLILKMYLEDFNRSLETCVIQNLLSTSTEDSFDEIAKHMSCYLLGNSDEFQIFVVKAVQSLALKHPRKQSVLMNHLADRLRSERNIQYKEAIASTIITIITIIEDNPEAKEKGLDHLCEFIEDCEHTRLVDQIRHLLGPRTLNPSRRQKEKPVSMHDRYAEQLSDVSEFGDIGPLFKSSLPLDLTESETEYVVTCIKHTFVKNIVLQFDCNNTLNNQLLEDVHVVVEGDGWKTVCSVPCSSLPYSQPGTCYTLLAIPNDIMSTTGNFCVILKFKVRYCDPVTGEPEPEKGYEDFYKLDVIKITVADHVRKVAQGKFSSAWEELGSSNELEDTFALAIKTTLDESITQVTQFLGMYPCERSDCIPEGKSSHTLYLAGCYRGGSTVLVRAKLTLSDRVTIQLTVRSENPYVSKVIASAAVKKRETKNIYV